jgi:hypothetical protein
MLGVAAVLLSFSKWYNRYDRYTWSMDSKYKERSS